MRKHQPPLKLWLDKPGGKIFLFFCFFQQGEGTAVRFIIRQHSLTAELHELRMFRQKSVNKRSVFFRFNTAGTVNQLSAGRRQTGGMRKYLFLQNSYLPQFS